MHNDHPKTDALKHCQPLLWNPTFAKEERQGVVAILASLWLLYLAWLYPYLDLKSLMTGTLHVTGAALARAIPGLIGLLLSQKLMAYARNLTSGAEELARDGILVYAEIIDRWHPEACQGSGELIAYRFDYLDACWIGEQPITHLGTDRQVGDRIAIRVLPRNPRICAIAAADRQVADSTQRLVSRQIKAAARRWATAARTIPSAC